MPHLLFKRTQIYQLHIENYQLWILLAKFDNRKYGDHSTIIHLYSSYRMWEPYKKGFKAYLQLEKSLSDNSVEAYLYDVEKLTEFLQSQNKMLTPEQVQLKDLQEFLRFITE